MPGRVAPAGDSRAVLISVGKYTAGYQPIPEPARSVAALRDILVDPQLCGWPAERVVVVEDPATVADLGRQLTTLAKLTTGVLMIYYVGHGELSTADELYLSVTTTDRDHLPFTALRWTDVRGALRDSPARVSIVVLDCCYAGNAFDTLAGADPENIIVRSAHVKGHYTLTATTRNKLAWLRPSGLAGAATAFTEELCALVRAGIDGRPANLSLNDLFPVLRDRLVGKGMPEPQQLGVDSVLDFAFTANAAGRTSSTAGASSSTNVRAIPPMPLHTTIDTPRAINALAYSPDGSCLAIAHRRGVLVWDLDLGRERFTAHHQGVGMFGAEDVEDLAVAPEGRRLITIGRDGYGRIWDLDTGSRLVQMRHEGAVSVGISPDGQTIATGRPGTKRPSTRLWQADTGRLLREFAAGGKVRFSPDGRYLAIADGGVHVMELSTGEDWTFDYGIRCIGWSPDGRYLAACDEVVSGGGQYTPTVRYGNVRIWSVASRTVEFTFQTASGPHDAAFSPDGRWLATIGNFRAQLWDLASRGPGVTVPRLLDIETTMPWSATTPAVCFSPDGRWLAAGSARQVQLWQLAG